MSTTIDTDDSERRLDHYQTEIDGQMALGLSVTCETTTAWLESTLTLDREAWR